MSAREGGCLCGAVRFRAAHVGELGVCHCRMCLKWTGGPFFGVTVQDADLTVSGPVHTYASSTWASRSTCATCGSALWYRAPGTHTHEVALGAFDDPSGLPVRREIYVDHGADGIGLTGDHPRYDAAQTRAMYEDP